MEIEDELSFLLGEYDRARYETPAGKARVAALTAFTALAADFESRYPQHAEPKAWQGWALWAQAGAARNFSSFGLLRKARERLEEAVTIDPDVFNGTPYIALGMMYGYFPPAPLSFGDEQKGRTYLLKALSMSPDGLEQNAAYGEFLLHKTGDNQSSLTHLKAALASPSLRGRELADKAIRERVSELIAKIDNGPH